MTLHLHILLWVSGALSPKEIREKLLSGDKEFERRLIDYLESVQVGQFLTGTKEEVGARIPAEARPKNKGIHTMLTTETTVDSASYANPTLVLPRSPPSDICESDCKEECHKCDALAEWYSHMERTVDDVLLRANVHKCDDDDDGKCAARFPRKIVKESNVDRKDGHINVKKLESSINAITPAVTYTNICNTDTTSLQSGTGIKATVGYVCDYLTKAFLKTH
ncbi:hypothetical protein BKA70DRAFT_1121318, partial [Coprinopsis sp. MPI-PUGE-AT-0042]